MAETATNLNGAKAPRAPPNYPVSDAAPTCA